MPDKKKVIKKNNKKSDSESSEESIKPVIKRPRGRPPKNLKTVKNIPPPPKKVIKKSPPPPTKNVVKKILPTLPAISPLKKMIRSDDEFSDNENENEDPDKEPDEIIKLDNQPEPIMILKNDPDKKNEQLGFTLPKEAGIFVMVGLPRSGKSHLIKSIIYDYCKGPEPVYKFGLAICKTRFNQDYDYVPEVWKEWDEQRLMDYFDKLGQWREDNKGKEIEPNFLILDDLLGESNLFSGWFNNLVSCHRHFNTTIFVSAQYISKAISTTMRNNTTIAFIFNTHFFNSIEGIFKAYGQLFDNMREFNAVFQDVTREKYNCMVFLQDEPDVNKNYFAYKAPKDIPKYKLEY